MGKRKVYVRAQASIPPDALATAQPEVVTATSEIIIPTKKHLYIRKNSTTCRAFDFSDWYNVGIDSITYACQNQIERFLASQDNVIEASTISTYCRNGLSRFLDYLALRAKALDHDLTLADINRDLIDGFISHNACLSKSYQRAIYVALKPVLYALGQRGLFTLIPAGDNATFPSNPFPNYNRNTHGETRLPKAQRQAFAKAVKTAVLPIWDTDKPVTGELLCYAVLIVALHTGRNTTSLLEMDIDCLRKHPKDNTTFLVVLKRRGRNTNKVALRGESEDKRPIESTPSIKINIEQLIRQAIIRTEDLRAEAPEDLKRRVWLYRSRGNITAGRVCALTDAAMLTACQKLVANYDLKDNDGSPLRINISRLRKTFANRVYELLDGDVATTAIALGNTPQVAGKYYLAPNDDSKRNWLFMGNILVEELLSRSIGATYKTPLGHCSDPVNGQFAPKTAGATCMNFLNCVRCQHYVVTADDLYKLFSFYFRIFAERTNMNKNRWTKEYAHIPRLIDDYIIAEGLRRGVFKKCQVDENRERARRQPHPFWCYDMSFPQGIHHEQ